MKGVLDRIEDGNKAVILVEEIDKQFIISTTQLPEDSHVHSWFDLVIEDDKITSISLDQQLTEQKHQTAEHLRNKVRAKKRSSKFKRN